MSREKAMPDELFSLSAAADMCFGLERRLDEKSLAAFLERYCNRDLLSVLIPRLSSPEIDETVAFLTGLLKKHLSEVEYHRLFLGETG